MIDEIEEALKAAKAFADWTVRSRRCMKADIENVVAQIDRAIETRRLEKGLHP